MSPAKPDAGRVAEGGVANRPLSQTLDRGLRLLELVAASTSPLSADALAADLGVHRSIAYRLLRTLADHRLVVQLPGGTWALGRGLAALARDVARDLTSAALPELAAVANEVGMTTILVVVNGTECLTLLSVEPRHSRVTVAQRPGTRHPIDRGAPGLAILSTLPPSREERPEVAEARLHGYARSRDEVVRGLTSLAVPVTTWQETVGALAVVFVGDSDSEELVVARLKEAAATIAAEMA